jgi:hypothetical protein
MTSQECSKLESDIGKEKHRILYFKEFCKSDSREKEGFCGRHLHWCRMRIPPLASSKGLSANRLARKGKKELRETHAVQTPYNCNGAPLNVTE